MKIKNYPYIISFLCLLMISILLNSVVSARSKNPPLQEVRQRTVIIPEGITEKEIPEPASTGGKYYVRYCNQCHNLPNPVMYSSDEWRSVFERMMEHATIIGAGMEGIELPSLSDKEEIIVYLQRNGLKAIPKGSKILERAGAFKFLWFCSTCHAPPDPSIHTFEDWKKVISRMNDHRKKWGRPTMSFEETEVILQFLKEGQALSK